MVTEARETKFGNLSVGDIILIRTKKGEMGIARIFSLDATHPSGFLKELNFHWTEKGETWKSGESLERFEERVRECSVICNIASEEEWRAIMHMYDKYGDNFRAFAKMDAINEKSAAKKMERRGATTNR